MFEEISVHSSIMAHCGPYLMCTENDIVNALLKIDYCFFLNNNSDIYFARHVFWIIKTATTSRYTLIIGQSLITLVDYFPFVSF